MGDPSVEGVRMGALAGMSQKKEVLEKIAELSRSQEIVIGDLEQYELHGADKEKGAFLPPIVFLNNNPFTNTACHEVEAFGPVGTIMPYDTLDEAIELSKLGKGSLVSSIITADDNDSQGVCAGSGPMHGRILVLNSDCAKESTGHGSPMPMLVHGGPGRAGGGEEMGGQTRRIALHATHGYPGFPYDDIPYIRMYTSRMAARTKRKYIRSASILKNLK